MSLHRTTQRRRETTAVGSARLSLPVGHERLRKQVDDVMAKVGHEIGHPMDEDVQELLAKLVALLSRIVEAGAAQLVAPVESAVDSLLGEKPNMHFARIVLRSAQQRLRRRHRLAPLMIGLGGGILAFAVVYTFVFLFLGPHQQFLGFDDAAVTNIALVTISGALGASISLILRIKDFSKLKDIDAEVLLYTAIFKPIVGAAFALFVFMALNAGIVQLTIAQGKDRFLFAAVAFIAGFSERFVKDVIHKVAGSVGDHSEEGAADAETATAELTGAIRTASLVTIPEATGSASLPEKGDGNTDELNDPRLD